jgi:transcriptional regulator with XRE-family HTH domain
LVLTLPEASPCVNKGLKYVDVTRSSRPAPTPDAITAALGHRLADMRKAAGIRSQEELGRRMAAYGVDWSRVSVEKLENGRRGAITVQELLALALVLDVPVPWLLVEPRSDALVPIAEGVEADPWAALLWLVGRRPLNSDLLSPGEWGRASAAIEYARQLSNGVRSLQEANSRRDMLAVDPEMDDVRERNILDALDAQELRVLQGMREPLRQLHEWGYTPYQLPTWVHERSSGLGVNLSGNDAAGEPPALASTED